MPASITQAERDKFSKKGKRLIDKRLVTGFNIEDFDPKRDDERSLIYGHDSPAHVRLMQKLIGGSVSERESYYKWRKDWTPGPNTTLLFDKKLARANEQYIQASSTGQNRDVVRRKGVKGVKGALRDSFIVPDVRLYNEPKQVKDFKTAWLITRRIDDDSRLSMMVSSKRKADAVRKELKYERVRKIRVQDYKPRKHSLFRFLFS